MKPALQIMDELEESFVRNTGKVSELTRQYALGGIGVVWIFRDVVKVPIEWNSTLAFTIIFFISTLCLDILQYLYNSSIAHYVAGQIRNDTTKGFTTRHGKLIGFSIYIFIIKIAFLLVGYILMMISIWNYSIFDKLVK
jgi:hypothetical protein